MEHFSRIIAAKYRKQQTLLSFFLLTLLFPFFFLWSLCMVYSSWCKKCLLQSKASFHSWLANTFNCLCHMMLRAQSLCCKCEEKNTGPSLAAFSVVNVQWVFFPFNHNTSSCQGPFIQKLLSCGPFS